MHNIEALKNVNQVVLSTTYPDDFYEDMLYMGELAKLAFYNGRVVGAICCRMDISKTPSGETLRKLYIMTLGCLPPYRRKGIGSRMVQHIMDIVEKDGNYDSIFLHVQVNNEDAINFCQKLGFVVVEIKQQYYEETESGDAYLLEKNLRKTDEKQNKKKGDIYNFNSHTFDTPSDTEEVEENR